MTRTSVEIVNVCGTVSFLVAIAIRHYAPVSTPNPEPKKWRRPPGMLWGALPAGAGVSIQAKP